MAATGSGLQLKGLGKKAMTALTTKAKRLGLTPERYIRELVRNDLELDRKARTTTLDQIWGPGREVDEAELDDLVESARIRHHRRTSNRK